MFRDTEEELDRIQRELLAEESPEDWEDVDDQDDDWEARLDALLDDPDDIGKEAPNIYRNYSNGYGRAPRPAEAPVYNTDSTDQDPEELSRELEEPPRQDRGFAVVVCLLLAAITLDLIYLAVQLLL